MELSTEHLWNHSVLLQR
ncbi:unnamed protein product [Linum tenue]|uniref:Uncharacterized protein n=1 Tax=Linum tenue TaxID=586396 RepID=A0AAV0LVH4_9ROSI|nr:unnamed protein product [Linum tenue]